MTTSCDRQKPTWAGDDLLSRGVNLLIRTPLLYPLMKQQARRVLIQNAERKGIPWREIVQRWQAQNLESTLATVTNPAIAYPDYYQQPFHAYAEGNLCWLAAFEAESATYVVALRVWKEEDLDWRVAQDRMRSHIFTAIQAYHPHPVNTALDVGCSVGISTEYLYLYLAALPDRDQPPQVIGLDLSPYMLAIAQQRDPHQQIAQWVHANAEQTDFADHQFDLITLQFVLHELPQAATRAILQEMRRILRPGGCLAIIDNDPKSPVIQNLPPVLFTLMKSTEPWSDEYYTLDVEAALHRAGFAEIQTVATDPRHRAILARSPRPDPTE